MKKLLLISLLKGVAITTLTHIAVSLMFGDEYWNRAMLGYVVSGLIVGYIIFRTAKEHKDKKI